MASFNTLPNEVVEVVVEHLAPRERASLDLSVPFCAFFLTNAAALVVNCSTVDKRIGRIARATHFTRLRVYIKALMHESTMWEKATTAQMNANTASQNAIVELQTANTELQNANAALQAENDSLQAVLTGLQTSNGAIEASLTDFEKVNAELHARVAVLERSSTAEGNLSAALQAYVDTLRARVAELGL